MDPPNPKPRRPLTPEALKRQRDGQYKGLLHAAQKRKADNSANYANNFSHGQMAFDFERSAEAAGESREELRAHLSLLDRTLLMLCGYFPRLGEALSGVSGLTVDSPLTPGPSPPRGRGENTFENLENTFENSENTFENSENGFENSETRSENSGSRSEGSVAGSGLPSFAENSVPSPAGNELPSPPWGRGAGGEGAAEGPADQAPRLPLHTDAASPRAPKLVRALALLLWRPFRLYRNQENWERLAICYRLEEMKRWRQQHSELTAERADKFHWDLDATLENYHSYTRERLKRIERRFWKVWRVYRGMVGLLGALFDGRGSVFGVRDSGQQGSGDGDQGPEMRDSGFGVRDSEAEAPCSGTESRAPNPESRATNHESQVTDAESRSTNTEPRTPNPESPIANHQSSITNPEPRTPNPGFLLQFRGTPHYEQFHPAWPERIDDLSPEAIGDPFQSPSHAMKAQQKRVEPASVKDPKEWQVVGAHGHAPSHAPVPHPPKPRPPEMDLSDRPASEFVRTPSERELKRLVRRGELTVPGSFQEFLTLVEEALGTRDSGFGVRGSGVPDEDSGPGVRDSVFGVRDSGAEAGGSGTEARNPNTESRDPKPENRTPNPERQVPNTEPRIPNPGPQPPIPDPSLHALAESLWNRMHVFSDRLAGLRELLEATLEWQPVRFLRLWLKLLPVEYAYDSVAFFKCAHGPNREDIAWGDDETTPPWRDGKRRPAETPRSEAEGRKQQGGELQHALRIWFDAVRYVLVPVMRSTHQVTVALYDWAVSRFGIREEFLVWRPNLSSVQRDTREGRPEWAVRVVTTTGKTLVKLRDGRMFEPDE
ncbi:MAG TPA: hypothetical protein VMT20_07990 [Terriglobia bacterium]|nr:hypothetical protein [Terriglobia bacterium]